MLNNISKAGELVEDCLVVSKEQLNILNKALKSKEKIQNAKMIVGNLKNFGFEIEGYNDKKAECFTISFPDNKFVIYAIKGFLQYDKLPNHIYSLHYYFATDEDILNSDRYSQIFSQYLDGEEKKFFDCFDQRLREESFSCRSNTGHGFTIEYRINKEDDSYLVRCYSENRKLSIVLRLRKFEKYLGAVNNFSSEVKTLFSATTCKKCNEKCNHRFTWEFDGSKYSACVYSNFTLTNYDKSAFENIDEYVKLLCLEREF